jgi:hypothetical protein
MVGVSSRSSQKYLGIGIKIYLDFSETIWYYVLRPQRSDGCCGLTYEATKRSTERGLL